MAMPETLKRVLTDLAVFSLSGVICIVGSFVLIKKVLPAAWFNSSAHAAPAVDEHAKDEAKKPEKPEKGEAKHGKEEKKHGEEGAIPEVGMYPLKSVIVNLADVGIRRFAKVTLSLQVENPKIATELQKIDAQIYDTLIKVISRYRYEEISSLEGKETLKQDVKSRINLVLKDELVSGVFITELIVQ